MFIYLRLLTVTDPAQLRTRRDPTVPNVVRVGHIGYGVLATFYDQDGDGNFEEASRSDSIIFDRNKDRIADIEIAGADGPEGIRTVEWDADFDGILDHAVTAEEGYVFRLVDARPISRPGSSIFREDGIQRSKTCTLGEPAYRHWERVIGITPYPEAEPPMHGKPPDANQSLNSP
ncbi:MAG: hypothetical protein NTW21_33430 [Verrucomicrobia bacterium]|nr:hypothetical protein [Verrucomicrobiota bacterium]